MKSYSVFLRDVKEKTLVKEEESDRGKQILHHLLTGTSVYSGVSSGGRDPVGRARGW